MSEAAPGTGDNPIFATAARAELAQALRELIEMSMLTTEVSDETLRATAAVVTQARATLGGTPIESHIGYMGNNHSEYLPRSPVVGEASPMSPRIDWEVLEGRCRARGVFTAQYEGPPGYVHGGMIALAFDEILGIVNIANNCPGMTGSLKVRYRKPTPLYRELHFEAWIVHVEGRRVQSRVELRDGDTLCAEADGLFIQPRPEQALEYFDRPMPT